MHTKQIESNLFISSFESFYKNGTIHSRMELNQYEWFSSHWLNEPGNVILCI